MNEIDPVREAAESAALYARLETILRAAACDLEVAECHGILTGMLCGPTPFVSAAWLAHLSADEDGGPLATGAARAELEALVEVTRAGLHDGGFSFVLLLPPETADLATRARAFAAWCRGFLAGCALGGIVDLAALGEDARGFLRDVERFCRLDVGAESDEDDERAFTELTEFTRVGAVLLCAEREARPRSAATPRLH